MKSLILMNNHEIDTEKDFLDLIKEQFPGAIYWPHFQEAFWPENKKETLGRFSKLKTGDNLACHHTFVDFQQLELMANLLHAAMWDETKLNVYIMHPALDKKIGEYLRKEESDIAPDMQVFHAYPNLRKSFKVAMNRIVREVMKYHNIYQLSKYKDHFKIEGL